MEKLASDAAITLTESVLGAAVLLLIILITIIVKLVFAHIAKSDERWTKSIDKQTDALQNIANAHRESGDKIAISIERALLLKSVTDNNHNSDDNRL